MPSSEWLLTPGTPIQARSGTEALTVGCNILGIEHRNTEEEKSTPWRHSPPQVSVTDAPEAPERRFQSGRKTGKEQNTARGAGQKRVGQVRRGEAGGG